MSVPKPETLRLYASVLRKPTRSAASCSGRPTPTQYWALGWGETAVYHLVAVVALFNYMNRLVEGLGIELNPSYAQTAGKPLADQGYLPLIELMKTPAETAKRNV